MQRSSTGGIGFGGGAGSARSVVGHPAAPPQSAGDAAVALGIARRLPDGSVEFDAPAGPGRAPVQTFSEGAASAEGTTYSDPYSDAGAFAEGSVQRVAAESSAASAPAGVTPAGSASAGSATAGSSAGTEAAGGLPEPPPSEAEQIASQALKMYPFIARQLRAEISRERDRRGHLSGFGH